MSSNPTAWMLTSLNACCTRHFPWKLNECLGTSGVASGLYYPDWDGVNISCTNDGKEPVYMALNPSVYMYATLESCCTKHYSWAYATCVGVVAPAQVATNKWYVDYNKNLCTKDCAVGGALCGGLASSSVTLFDDIAECCKQKVSWVLSYVCIAESQGLVPSGTNKWYVSYGTNSCVKDCIGSAPCGGLAQSWESLYINPSACCSTKLSWVDSTKCVADSGGP